MKVRYLADQIRYQTMNTDEFRQSFLVDDLFQQDKLTLYYTEADRGIQFMSIESKHIGGEKGLWHQILLLFQLIKLILNLPRLLNITKYDL